MRPTASDKPSLVITDASCLIILEKIEQLELLPKLFNLVVTTPAIAQEYGKALPFWIDIRSVADKQAQAEFSELVDSGEASAIALAKEINYDYLIIDDLQGRKLAVKLGLTIIGTLGILLAAKQQGLIPLLKPVLEQVKDTNFRITDELIQRILRTGNEI